MAFDVHAMAIDQLSIGERLELIDRIWESLPEPTSTDDVPAWHLAEIERRHAEALANPGQGKPWREVLDRLGNKP